MGGFYDGKLRLYGDMGGKTLWATMGTINGHGRGNTATRQWACEPELDMGCGGDFFDKNFLSTKYTRSVHFRHLFFFLLLLFSD